MKVCRNVIVSACTLVPWLHLTAQVNLHTGSANFSLPVFDWKDNKSRLAASVGLGYSSGNGLKVNEVASNVGQGWSLIAGGVITRLQVGEPDDQEAFGTIEETDVRKYPAGYLKAATPAYKGCPEALTRYPLYGSKNQVYAQHNAIAEDKQLDYFSYQFNGKSGLFVLNNENGDNGLSLGDTKMKITFQRNMTMTSQGKRSFITGFTITDIDGLIYKFTQQGLTKVLQSNYCDATLNQFLTQPKFANGNVYYQAAFDGGPYTPTRRRIVRLRFFLIRFLRLSSILPGYG